MRFILSEPVFGTFVTFCINEKKSRTRKLVKKNISEKDFEELGIDKLENEDGYALDVTLKDGAKGHLVSVKNFDWSSKQMAILGHEIVHLVFAILSHKGVPIRTENDETFAYLWECYFRQAVKKIPKKL